MANIQDTKRPQIGLVFNMRMKGCKNNCNNYRGIVSELDAILKNKQNTCSETLLRWGYM